MKKVKINKTHMNEIIIKYLIYLWVLVLVFRSAQYVFRTYEEFKNPPSKVYEKINICQPPGTFKDYTDNWLHTYLEIGGKCERF